jgi:FixJ family two-component response regulator
LLGFVHVVDDDASFRTAFERRLKKAGYEVATYPSAQHLLDRLPSESEPGCILLDVRIPALSGPELQGRLSELGSTPAYHIPHWLSRYFDHGAGH